jgi:2-iminobutanoate/2-iminopropanoate deaminase
LRKAFDNPEGVPPPVGNYSHVARIEVGDATLLLVSGQVAVDENGELVGEGSMTEQAERVFESIGAILAAHGASFADVVNLRSYLTDLGLVREYREVRARYLTGDPPTSTTVEVSGLLLSGALLEVEVLAVRERPAGARRRTSPRV